MSQSVHIVTLPVVLTGATQIPLAKLPAGGGGITIKEAHIMNVGTSVAPLLVTMTNAGTPAISGTIGAISGTITGSATIPQEFTISDGYVAEEEWIGFDQTSGTITAGAFVTLGYQVGK